MEGSIYFKVGIHSPDEITRLTVRVQAAASVQSPVIKRNGGDSDRDYGIFYILWCNWYVVFGVRDDGEDVFPIMGIRNGDGGGIDEGDMNYNDGSDDFHSQSL